MHSLLFVYFLPTLLDNLVLTIHVKFKFNIKKKQILQLLTNFNYVLTYDPLLHCGATEGALRKGSSEGCGETILLPIYFAFVNFPVLCSLILPSVSPLFRYNHASPLLLYFIFLSLFNF